MFYIDTDKFTDALRYRFKAYDAKYAPSFLSAFLVENVITKA
jgi:hypothetical protein